MFFTGGGEWGVESGERAMELPRTGSSNGFAGPTGDGVAANRVQQRTCWTNGRWSCREPGPATDLLDQRAMELPRTGSSNGLAGPTGDGVAANRVQQRTCWTNGQWSCREPGPATDLLDQTGNGVAANRVQQRICWTNGQWSCREPGPATDLLDQRAMELPRTGSSNGLAGPTGNGVAANRVQQRTCWTNGQWSCREPGPATDLLDQRAMELPRTGSYQRTCWTNGQWSCREPSPATDLLDQRAMELPRTGSSNGFAGPTGNGVAANRVQQRICWTNGQWSCREPGPATDLLDQREGRSLKR